MPNQPANPMLGWRPPLELSAWVRMEAGRRGVDLKVILDEALSAQAQAEAARRGVNVDEMLNEALIRYREHVESRKHPAKEGA